MSKFLEKAWDTFLESVDDLWLEDLKDDVSPEIENIEEALEELKPRDALDALSRIEDEMNELWESVESKEIKEELENYEDAVEDEIDEMVDQLKYSTLKKTNQKPGFFKRIYNSGKKLLNFIWSVKSANRLLWWVLWSLWLTGLSSKINNLLTKKFNWKVDIFDKITTFNQELKKPKITDSISKSATKASTNPKIISKKESKKNETLWYEDAYSQLSTYYRISSSDKGFEEDWSSRESCRTCLDWIKLDTILWAENLAKYISKETWLTDKGVVTWWTEDWHDKTLKFPHHEWYKLDFRSTDRWWKTVINKFWLVFEEAKTVMIEWQNLTFYYHWDEEHIDVLFGTLA